MFTLVSSGTTRIHPGEAHVTPSRYVVHVVLRDNAGGIWWVVAAHLISKAWTDHPERRPRWIAGIEAVAAAVATLREQYPDAVGIVAGDFNRGGRFPELAAHGGVWAAPTNPRAAGLVKYDQIVIYGPAAASPPVYLDTRSDHKAVRVTIERTHPQ